MFNIPTNTWTWKRGSNTEAPNGNIKRLFAENGSQFAESSFCSCFSAVYGTKSVGTTSTVPGGRKGAIPWTDLSNSLWFLGGEGYDNTSFVRNEREKGFLFQ
jgi:hypothetical protein